MPTLPCQPCTRPIDSGSLPQSNAPSSRRTGRGPGSGPVAATAELVRYLPGPRPVRRDDGAFDWGSEPESIGRVHGWHGNVGIDVRAYSYLLALGGDGLRRVSEMAVLNANYLLAQLAGDYDVPYPGPVLHL